MTDTTVDFQHQGRKVVIDTTKLDDGIYRLALEAGVRALYKQKRFTDRVRVAEVRR